MARISGAFLLTPKIASKIPPNWTPFYYLFGSQNHPISTCFVSTQNPLSRKAYIRLLDPFHPGSQSPRPLCGCHSASGPYIHIFPALTNICLQDSRPRRLISSCRLACSKSAVRSPGCPRFDTDIFAFYSRDSRCFFMSYTVTPLHRVCTGCFNSLR